VSLKLLAFAVAFPFTFVAHAKALSEINEALEGAWQPKMSVCLETQHAVPNDNVVEQYVFDGVAETVQIGVKDQECDIAVKYSFRTEGKKFILFNPKHVYGKCANEINENPSIDEHSESQMTFEMRRTEAGDINLIITLPAGTAPECGVSPKEVTLVRIPLG